MGAAPDEVVIKNPLGNYVWSNYQVIIGSGNNVVSNLKVWPQYWQNAVYFFDDCTIHDCNVDAQHGGITGYENLAVTRCEVSGLTCVGAKGTFTISDCNLYPGAMEATTGIGATASGTIENVNIQAALEASYPYTGGCLGGILLKLDQNEKVTIVNVSIGLQLTATYNPGDTGTLRVFGILSGSNWGSPTTTFPGKAVIKDCTIDVNGIESTGSDPNDPDDDGQAIMVDGICIRGGGTIGVCCQTEITTARTTASHAEDGYEYSLNNENGTMLVCAAPNAVIYDANKTNGTIDEFLVLNETQASFYLEIQEAIDDASSGDDIVAYPVTYYETVDFNGLAISLSSSDPNDPEVVAATIIDANEGSRAVYFHNSETSSSVLRGFTITGADHGIYCNGASPVIENCVITENEETSEDGAGMYNDDSSPTVTGCVFSDNWADYGGGMYNYDESCPTVTNCLFYDNEADEWGGGMYNDYDSCPIIVNCTFFENTAEYGGGIYNEDDSDAELTNCIFWDNDADDGEEIYNDNAEPEFRYCCVRGGVNGTYCGGDNSDNVIGNISDDPDFEDDTDPEGTDNIWATCDDGLRLDSTSDCIDEGDNDAVPSGVATDIKGSDRIIDGDVDMGAYEYDSGC